MSNNFELGTMENINNHQEDDEELLNSFPAGYRFKPRDDELVLFYLKPKLLNLRLPPNRIRDVELYHYNPQQLIEKYGSYGEEEWYFFTPRDKKYRNGLRPNRAAGDGYWKATGADKILRSESREIGYRKALVFCKGKPPKGEKTDWMMHEFRLKDPPAKLSQDEMRLDDWILCKIYQKSDKSTKNSALISDNPQGVVSFEYGSDEFGEMDDNLYCDFLMFDHNPSLLLDDNICDYYDPSLMPMAMVEQGRMDSPDKKTRHDDKHFN
ncbi:hypothetical protein J1N35_019618 [Gossypium stocksii]|uniref:NAC domain-containing protein n=1 Tax=Gossypium stocksii TaxID=47602 RepID=A0A9D3VR81_9ROSI|nr:hypothetical protein J1N35_019618 [Gossypium stocksii]